MATILRLDDKTSVCGQLKPADMEEIARLGFGAVVNNRPDGEQWIGQPRHADLANAAEASGLAAHAIQFTMQTLSASDAVRFVEAAARAQKPVLAFCASGFRSALLWAIATAASTDRPLEDMIRSAPDFPLAAQRATIERLGAETRRLLDDVKSE